MSETARLVTAEELERFPEDETVSIFRPHAENALSADDDLDLDDILPGFRCRAGEIFG